MKAFGLSPTSVDVLVRNIAQMRVFAVAPTQRSHFKRVKAGLKVELQRVLSALGSELQMETWYTNPPQREFMYDLVWINVSGVMTLAVECESSGYPGDVIYDFKKLLHAKAPMKLLLFADSRHMGDIFDRIKEELNAYGGHLWGEQYVLVQFCNFTTGCLEAYSYEVPTAEGSRVPVTFTKCFEHRWPT